MQQGGGRIPILPFSHFYHCFTPPIGFLSLTHILYTFPSFLISAPSFIHSSPSSSCRCVQRQPIADGVTYICLNVCALLVSQPGGKAEYVTGCVHACECVQTHRLYSTVNDVIQGDDCRLNR